MQLNDWAHAGSFLKWKCAATGYLSEVLCLMQIQYHMGPTNMAPYNFIFKPHYCLN